MLGSERTHHGRNRDSSDTVLREQRRARVSQTLTERIRQLAERYATPLPQLTGEVTALADRVDGHLKKMGAVWK
jgi:type I restriction enzyme M protein